MSATPAAPATEARCDCDSWKVDCSCDFAAVDGVPEATQQAAGLTAPDMGILTAIIEDTPPVVINSALLDSGEGLASFIVSKWPEYSRLPADAARPEIDVERLASAIHQSGMVLVDAVSGKLVDEAEQTLARYYQSATNESQVSTSGQAGGLTDPYDMRVMVRALYASGLTDDMNPSERRQAAVRLRDAMRDWHARSSLNEDSP